MNISNSLTQAQNGTVTKKTLPSTSNGGFVNKVRLIPKQSGSTPTHGAPRSGAILTQARKSDANNVDIVSSHSSNGSTPSTPVLTFPGSSSGNPPAKQWIVDERRLAQWQQQPHNLSPATHLNLDPMLPPALPSQRHKPLLVLDIDETLVHASFTPAKPYHVKITIEVDGETGDIFVAYRPHLFTFLDAILPLFEVAIFTASQSCYADQLMDHIDPQGRLGKLRLFREHCTEVNGARVKDLSLLGRQLHRVALVDNSPVTYLFQPRNAIPILSWFDDPRDTELLKLLPMLRQLAQSSSVYDVLDLWNCATK